MLSRQPKTSLQDKSRHEVGMRWRLRTVLLATSALASVGLMTAAHAADATWLANPASGNFGDAANWDVGIVPSDGVGTATFNASSQRDILLTGSNQNGFLSIGALSVTAGAGNYTFTTAGGSSNHLDISGAGLNAANGASIRLINNSIATFLNGSSAGNASIANSFLLSFVGSSTAANSTLTNSGDLFFRNDSTADHASINSTGRIFFTGQARGGTARIAMTSANSVLDISGLTTSGTTVGSLEGSGNVFLGNKNLAVGGNNISTTFAGVIQDGGVGGGTGGSLTKEGTGTLTLTGVNTYTGATAVKNGELRIDGSGSIASSSGVTIDGNGRLIFAGSSTAANLTLTNSATVQFLGNSNAGGARIINDHGGLFFDERSSAGQSTITNGQRLDFRDNSTAANATITNNAGGVVFFLDQTTAANATIINHREIDFVNSSTADTAFIQSDDTIVFGGQASGGTARIAMTGAASVLDISSLTTSGTTLGSIEGSGKVFLGGKHLAVGGNDLSTSFAGVIQDGSTLGVNGAGGSLTKEGKGALTLTGQNAYTGATNVIGGALVVDGSIATSSSVTVGAGSTLAGTGTVSSTTVKDGGTLLAGHGDAPFGALTVQGSLAFASGATYLVQVSPDNAGLTNVRASAAGQGDATLGGATVNANFAKGSYVTRQYNVLHADGGLNSSTFGNLVNTNLAPFFVASLSYGTNDVFLDLTAKAPDSIPGLNVNQRNVARGIVNSFNLVGGIPGAFATLTSPASLTQVSGETAVGSQQATFDAMGQFMGVMLDPTVTGRSGGAASNAYASASMPRKAPVADAFSSRWGVWAAGFGGSQSVNGDAVLGSNKTTSSIFGSAVGADYRVSPNTVVGFALAGGGTGFRVANGGSGSADLFQAGGYLRHTQGAAFIAAALAYGWQDVTTNRTVTAAGFDSLRGRFNANALSGRLEGGYRVSGAVMDVTPYAAGQFVSYRLPSYAEQVASGASTFALNYGGKDVTASRTELGVRTERSFAQDDASLLTLRGRLAWAHDFNTDRNVQAAFLTLPGSAFVVNGAQGAANTALTSMSAELAWRNGWAASATFDGQFSDTTRSYAGKGVVRYAW